MVPALTRWRPVRPVRHRRSPLRAPVTAVAATISMVVAGAALSACGGGSDDAAGGRPAATAGFTEPTALVGYAAQPPTEVGDLSLPDASTGAPLTFRADPGKVLLAYFGYTHCPDVCPTSLTAVKSALRQLGPELAARVQLTFSTVDPTRDTAAVLAPYVQYYVADGRAARTTDDAALRAVTDRLGVEYSVSTAADGTVEVAHTGSIFAIDPAGKVVDVLPFPMAADDVAGDLALLLRRIAT